MGNKITLNILAVLKLKPLRILVILITLFFNVTAQNYNPVANQSAIVVSENIRFTILTPRVIRMEWAEDGVFEDNASLTFINRNLPVPKFKKTQKDGWLQIKTEALTLKYKIGSGKFNKNNLTIDYRANSKSTLWHIGLKNESNLLGTTRTLDACNGDFNEDTNTKIELEEGLLSRDGWVVIDDSEKPLFDNTEWAWVTPRTDKKAQDLYFFGYGTDYKGCLKEFTKIAGKIALPPKFAFGSWWSKYWAYTDVEYKELVKEFEIHDVPLDVLVIDMDWHIADMKEWYDGNKKLKDAAGQRSGWTGFTWNKKYFPDHKKFLKWTDEKNIKTCLNLIT